MTENCDNCRFWLGDEYPSFYGRAGRCRRHPPKEAQEPYFHGPDQGQKPDRYISVVRFPETKPDDWCGEWKAKT